MNREDPPSAMSQDTTLIEDLPKDEHKPKLESLITHFVMFLVIITLPLSLLVILKKVSEYERLVIYRLGWLRDGKTFGPGLVFYLPCIDIINLVDLRTVTFDVPSQEVLTRDSCSVSVDAVVYYRVKDPIQAIQVVKDHPGSSWILAATTLRAVLGRHVLAEILSEREALSYQLRLILDEATAVWGVKIENVEIKDVRLPMQMQRAMAAEAEATREARARIINAEGEMKAAYNLREASDIISSSPAAIKLRYLQTISVIAAEKKSTILFPVPLKL